MFVLVGLGSPTLLRAVMGRRDVSQRPRLASVSAPAAGVQQPTPPDLVTSTAPAAKWEVASVQVQRASGRELTLCHAQGQSYPSPTWIGHRPASPVVVKRGDRLQAELCLIPKDPAISDNVQVLGWSARLGFLGPVVPRRTGSFWVARGLTAARPVQNRAGMYDPLTLQWWISVDQGKTWSSLTTTTIPVYILMNEPEPSAVLVDTLVDLTCRAGTNAVDRRGLLMGLWPRFASLQVSRLDGRKLCYYGNWSTEAVSTADLLAAGDGQCDAWVNLLRDMLAIHGVAGGVEPVRILPPSTSDCRTNRLLLGAWQRDADGPGRASPLPFLNIARNPIGDHGQYHWAYTELKPTGNLPGQGGTTPPREFHYHMLLNIDGTLYDPSYGRTYNSLEQFENQMVFGYAMWMPGKFDEANMNLDLDGDGDKTDAQVPVNCFALGPRDTVRAEARMVMAAR
ncbi:MAG: hypothetical protein IT430_14890 [Phycisphaerales bacterium]|nr:hypothetical protein [Phycisphaerales bacterium]